MKISQIGEFGLIERIQHALPAPGHGVLVGIGDDTAVLKIDPARVLLATCDTQVEGIHFLRDAITPFHLGLKALAINLSDIASMGGTPRFALVSLGLPDDLPVEFVDGLYAGLRTESEKFGVNIVGGNISASPSGLFIDITLLGDASPDNILTRSGAHVGDQIMVTGTVGDAAAGVALLLNAALTTTQEYSGIAQSRRDTPSPRMSEGQLIGAAHKATAMIDISDGLAGDLGHLCESSGVGVRLFAGKLPVAEENRALALAKNGNEWYFALHGGEDYELLFTAPVDQAGSLAAQITHQTGTPVSIIGEILPLAEGQQLVLQNGQMIPLRTMGWDHFKEIY